MASFFGLNINLKENILNPVEFMVQVVGLTSKAITTGVLFFYLYIYIIFKFMFQLISLIYMGFFFLFNIFWIEIFFYNVVHI